MLAGVFCVRGRGGKGHDVGLLRLLLALSVLFDHTGGVPTPWGVYTIIGGPLAVECFFIISGFYMGLVLNERYDRPALTGAFYANRAIRIFSLYYLFLALYLAVFVAAQAGSGASPLWPYLTPTLPLHDKALLAALNFTVIGQDLPLWLRIDHGHLVWTIHAFHTGQLEVFHLMAIPMAWSLSLELCFYALAPWVARRPVWQIAALMGASLAARVGAAAMGYADDPFSYRFFPFELALFLAGVLAYRAWAAHRAVWDQPRMRLLALAVPLAILTYAPLTGSAPGNGFFAAPRVALLVLAACGLPAIHGWGRRKAWDRAVGELSYPLYLDQLLVFAMMSGLPVLAAHPGLRTLAVAAVSIALAYVVVRFVDARIEAVRARLAARAGAHAVLG